MLDAKFSATLFLINAPPNAQPYSSPKSIRDPMAKIQTEFVSMTMQILGMNEAISQWQEGSPERVLAASCTDQLRA